MLGIIVYYDVLILITVYPTRYTIMLQSNDDQAQHIRLTIKWRPSPTCNTESNDDQAQHIRLTIKWRPSPTYQTDCQMATKPNKSQMTTKPNIILSRSIGSLLKGWFECILYARVEHVRKKEMNIHYHCGANLPCMWWLQCNEISSWTYYPEIAYNFRRG